MPDKSNEIVIIGGGGHAKACRDVIESITAYSISMGGRIRVGPVIVDSRRLDDEMWQRIVDGYENFFIGVGHVKECQARRTIWGRLVKLTTPKFPTFISPYARVSPDAKVGEGAIIMHNASVNAGAEIGDFSIINTGAIVEHDAKIGDFTHISTGAVINGDCEIAASTFIGSNAVVLNEICIGPRVVLGAGSVAINNITESGVWVGNPARFVKCK